MNKPHPEMRETEYLVIGAGNRLESLSVPASESSFVETVSYEEAMQPHVNYVKKSSANLKQYYAVACSVVSGFGKRRGLRL